MLGTRPLATAPLASPARRSAITALLVYVADRVRAAAIESRSFVRVAGRLLACAADRLAAAVVPARGTNAPIEDRRQ